jgi:hypothetical protein
MSFTAPPLKPGRSPPRLFVTSGAEWDYGRNTSAVRPPAPGALKRALQALAALRARDPALYKWISDGHPTLTEAEHIARFGGPYTPRRP